MHYRIAFLRDGAWEDTGHLFKDRVTAESYLGILEEYERVRPLDSVVYTTYLEYSQEKGIWREQSAAVMTESMVPIEEEYKEKGVSQ